MRYFASRNSRFLLRERNEYKIRVMPDGVETAETAAGAITIRVMCDGAGETGVVKYH